jgi:hypothetical protein
MTKPNFFIIGAPKCGTTALYTYLQQHPDVYFPEVKEPHFFGADLHKRSDVFVLEADRYLSLFSPGRDKAIRGEASTNYVFSESAPEEIHQFARDARIVLMLRPPVDQLYSAHAQYLYSGNEIIDDFWAALDAEPERLTGKGIPPQIDLREKVLYQTNLRKIPGQIRRLRDLFGSSGVKVILLEDMKAAPQLVYEETLEFLGVPFAPSPDFAVVNASKAPRSPAVYSLIRRFGEPFGRLRRRLSSRPLGVMSWIYRLNTVSRARPALDLERRLSLAQSYSDWVNELEELLERDLSHWLR